MFTSRHGYGETMEVEPNNPVSVWQVQTKVKENKVGNKPWAVRFAGIQSVGKGFW